MKHVVFIKDYLTYKTGKKMSNMDVKTFNRLFEMDVIKEVEAPDKQKEVEDKEKILKNYKNKMLKQKDSKKKQTAKTKAESKKKRLEACPECQAKNEPCEDCE